MISSNDKIAHVEYGKLLTISDDNKIVTHYKNNSTNTINSNKPNNCVVVSMIGCARVGKSTFINAFISSILNTNVNIVNTSSSAEHCTIGIDYVMIDEIDHDDFSHLIILDCQGLSYGDSKNDDKLLSVIYMLSDVVIFHEPGILNNQTLNTLTSLCLVADYIKTDEIVEKNKPTLFFRMRDYNLDCDPNDISSKTFDMQGDQYDKVRGAIKKLFPEILTIKTDQLGKKEQQKLKNGEYLEILENDEYGFVCAFDTVIHSLSDRSKTKTTDQIFKSVGKISDQINSNKKISFNDYDYYTLLIKQRFREYTGSIDSSIYSEIKPTMYEHTYVECMDRLNLMNGKIYKIKNIFSEVEKSLLDEEIKKFKNKIEPNVLLTIEKIKVLAMDFIFNQLQTQIDSSILPVFTSDVIEDIMYTKEFEQDICNAINKIGDYFSKKDLCVIHIDHMKNYLHEQICRIKKLLSDEIKPQREINNYLYAESIDRLKHMTDLEYIKRQIDKINNFTQDYAIHFSTLQQKLINNIYDIFDGKPLRVIVENIVFVSEHSNLVLVRKFRPFNFSKFIELKKQIDDEITIGLFTNKSIVLKRIYVNRLKSYYLTSHIDLDIIDKQSLLNNITLLKLKGMIRNKKDQSDVLDIIQKITTIKCNIYESDTDLHYYQTNDNVEVMLTKLTDFVGLKYEIVNKFSVKTPCNKKNNNGDDRNITRLELNFSDNLYGRVFLEKLIDKYVETEYLL